MTKTTKLGRAAHSARVEREMRLLIGYFDEGSPTKGDLSKSTWQAGYSYTNAAAIGQKIVDRFSNRTFQESVRALGMTKPYLAAKVREIIEDKESKPETRLMAIKMLLNNFGEKTETGNQTVNINSPKTLVIVGTSQKKIDAMLCPPQEIPQLEVQIERPDVQP